MSFTTKLYGKVIIPSSYYLKGDLRFAYFEEYKKNLTKSKKEIREFQLDRLKKLIRHAYDTVPYYRDLFDKYKLKPSDIRSIQDLKKIPTLDKKTIINNIDRLKSSKKYKLIEYCSGGTTGSRVVVFKDKRYEQISRAVWMRDLYSRGIEVGRKSAWIWAAELDTLPLKEKLLHRLLWRINRRIIFNPFKFTEAQLEKWLLNDFNKFRPDYLIGYSGPIYEIAKFIDKNKIDIHPLKKIMSTAEPLEHREFIEKVFKCKVVNHYGCREITTIAIEDENHVMHTSDDFVIVEVGKNNQIILTPLESYGMPLLRYVNGDMGAALSKIRKIKSKSPFKQFNLVVGRLSDYLINKNNEKVMGPLIAHFVGEKKLTIGEFQLVQKSLKDVELNIVRDSACTEKDINEFKKMIKNILGNPKITINYLDKFPVEKNGKRIYYKCMIKHKIL